MYKVEFTSVREVVVIIPLPIEGGVEGLAGGGLGADVAEPRGHGVGDAGAACLVEEEVKRHRDNEPFVIIAAPVDDVIAVRKRIPEADPKPAGKDARSFNANPLIAGEKLAGADFEGEAERFIVVIEIDEILKAGVRRVELSLVGQFADFMLKADAKIAPLPKSGGLKAQGPVAIDGERERFS